MRSFFFRPRWTASATALFLIGCDAAPRQATPETTPAEAPSLRIAEVLPVQAGPRDGARPDLAQLSYDPLVRRLRVYALTDGARWLLMLPGFPMGVPIEGEYDFPVAMDCELDQVQLVITAPNRRTGPAVSLRDILDGGAAASR